MGYAHSACRVLLIARNSGATILQNSGRLVRVSSALGRSKELMHSHLQRLSPRAVSIIALQIVHRVTTKADTLGICPESPTPKECTFDV